ncbi:MAG: sugar phosphate isomerase/epimerase [Treponema sp.]|nr:sugar phosphate isomerase/epimerase [Treponema sp.]
MAVFILSAFADEAAGTLDEQIKTLEEENISLIELRGVDGKNCADLTEDDAKKIAEKLSAHKIGLSTLGSPFGKIGITDDFAPHLEKFKASLKVCKILNCTKIRMFSFYMPQNEKTLRGDYSDYREEVFARLEQMLDLAEKEGILLVHENEKGIYGDTDERCMELYNHFGGRLGIAFDPANYVQCKVNPKNAYELQKDTITYFHMKDALFADGSVVCVGNGDGSVPFILEDVNKTRNDKVILTIEPHLHIFNGLEKLQSEVVQHKESYSDSRSAFHAACAAVKKYIF